MILAYLGYRVQNGSFALIKDEKKRVKAVYITIGAVMGVIFAFICPIVAILVFRLFSGQNLAYAQGGGEIWVSLFLVLPLIGATASYYIGKRNGFTLPSWMTY